MGGGWIKWGMGVVHKKLSGWWPRREDETLTTPLPKGDMVVIFLTQVSQGFQVTMLFPLIVFMVTDFGVAEHNPHLIGRYAGFLSSLFPFAQFCTSLFWGSVSDKVGRKPVLIFGSIVASVSAVLFGLSGSYTMACLVRLIGGFLNGVITVTKSTLGEVCDKTNQRQGFAVLSLAWGIGTIAGQVIGGVAARPCQQYNIQNCPVILESYPFILPCLGAALFSAVAAVATLFLRETLDKNRFQKLSVELVGGGMAKGSKGVDVSDRKAEGGRGFLRDLGGNREQDEERGLLMAENDSEARMTIGRLKAGAREESHMSYEAKSADAEGADQVVSGMEAGSPREGLDTTQKGVLHAGAAENGKGESMHGAHVSANARVKGITFSGKDSQIPIDVRAGDYGSQESLLMNESGGGTFSGGERLKTKGGGYEKLEDVESGLGKEVDGEETTLEKNQFYLQDPDVWIASGTYGMTAFIHIIADELFPIFGAAPVASGGLSYSASSIGLLGGLSGAVLFLFTLLFLKLNPRSARQCFALGTILVLPAFILMPLTSLLRDALTWQWWAAALLLIEKNVAACIGFTGAMVLVSNASDSSNMGAIVGFSHSIGAFARAAGPFIGGSMWSFSVALQLPLSQFIPWEFIAVLTLLTLILAALVKPYLDTPKSERSSLNVPNKHLSNKR